MDSVDLTGSSRYSLRATGGLAVSPFGSFVISVCTNILLGGRTPLPGGNSACALYSKGYPVDRSRVHRLLPKCFGVTFVVGPPFSGVQMDLLLLGLLQLTILRRFHGKQPTLVSGGSCLLRRTRLYGCLKGRYVWAVRTIMAFTFWYQRLCVLRHRFWLLRIFHCCGSKGVFLGGSTPRHSKRHYGGLLLATRLPFSHPCCFTLSWCIQLRSGTIILQLLYTRIHLRHYLHLHGYQRGVSLYRLSRIHCNLLRL